MALSEVGGSHFMRSPQCEVHWAGFVGDTWHMQQAGWEFAKQDDYREFGLRRPRIAFRHRKAGWAGIAEGCEEDLMYASHIDGRHYSENHFRKPVFEAVAMRVDQDHVYLDRNHRTMILPKFSRVDMEPEIQYLERVSLRACEVFREWREPQEIIVEPATVYGLLEQIKRLQAPDLAEMRERNRRREASERIPEIRHATILSFGT